MYFISDKQPWAPLVSDKENTRFAWFPRVTMTAAAPMFLVMYRYRFFYWQIQCFLCRFSCDDEKYSISVFHSFSTEKYRASNVCQLCYWEINYSVSGYHLRF